MVSTPRKRNASRSPDGSRHYKRLVTSSPEEGEVDDTGPSAPNPTIQPISLPPKPKVPFPFKKKAEPGKNGSMGDANDSQAAPMNVFAKFEENVRKDKEDPRRQRPRPMPKNNGGDRWEPSYGSEKSLLSRIGPPAGSSHYHPPRDSWEGRDRDRRRSPIRHSPRRSRSPSPPTTSYHKDKHRLPQPRSPANFSPPSTQFGLDRARDRSRDRGYDRDRERERERDRDRDRSRDRHSGRNEDSRRYARRNSPADDDARHYRPDYRRDDREWTRRDDSYQPDRDRPSRADDRRYDYDRRHDSSRYTGSRQPSPPPRRPKSPGPPPPPSLPSRPVSPPPQQPPPPSLPPPPSTETPKPPQPSASPPPPASLPYTGPRPPSSTPPPAPPPDIRLMKDPQLPPIHAQVKITMKRPEAPVNTHSPLPLELPPVSTAKAMAQGPEMKSERPQPSKEPQQPTEIRPPQKEPEQPKLKIIRRKLPPRRSNKLEVLAYGHGFVGCGQQSDYEATTKLGEGTFGEVHKAIRKANGTLVALKRILMHNEKEGMPVTALREIKILKALKHPSIVNILDMFVVRSTEKDPLSVYMVFPYMDHDLAGLLENERVQLQPSHIKLYMKQLLEGTEYMHRNHILHRDMKAANLLISNDGSLKIADFGLARSFDATVPNRSGDGTQRGRERKYTNCVVTRWYRPPELLLGARQYGGEVDIWGIGCVLGEMFTRRPILPGTSDLDQLDKIWILCGSPNQHNWPYFDQLPGCEGVRRFNTNHSRKVKQTFDSMGPETVDLLDKLLVLNPRERLTAAQALDHDYFWTDPLPADPKTMPSYEASHEFDKRGHRHHQPMPVVPPPPQRHPLGSHIVPPPPNNYNNRGGIKAYGRGPQPPPGTFHQPPSGPPLQPVIPPGVPNHPAYRGLPPPQSLPLVNGYPPLGLPVLPPSGPHVPHRGPTKANMPGGYHYTPTVMHPQMNHPRQPYMNARGQGGRREPQRNNNNSGPRLPPNPSLPPKPPAPLGLANSSTGGAKDSERDRHRDRGNSDRPRGDSVEDALPELNYD